MTKTKEIKETLEKLGFKLEDRGNFWSTNAFWRGGDNKTAVQIYKDTGVWRDFVEGIPPSPFPRLIGKVLRTNDPQKISEYFKSGKYIESGQGIFDGPENKETIKMEKTYNKSVLKDLLPHYKFYTDKNISENTLRMYQGGFATKGKMNNRYVFPIFDLEKKEEIIGFSGRSMLWEKGNRKMPKWKHLGTKKNWIYPFCLDEKFERLAKNGQIYIIESIGDSLALTENGFCSQLVTFGLDLSSKQISSLISQNPDKITISMNNDASSAQNAGLESSIKHFVSLMDYFDLDKIEIKLPPPDYDLSDLHKQKLMNQFTDKTVKKETQLRAILNYTKNPFNAKKFKKNQKLEEKVEKIKFYLGEDFD
jgi:hypothetical protein